MSKLRKRLNDKEAEFLGFDILESKSGNPKYTLSKKEWQTIYKMRTTPNERKFVETQKKLNKDGEILSTLEKLQSEPIDIPENFEVIKISTSKTTGQQWIQYAPKPIDISDAKEIDYKTILKNYVKAEKIKPKIIKTDFDFDSTTYTDVHVGMDTNKDNNSMYAEDWNKEEVFKLANSIVTKTLENKKSNLLVLDDLGDVLDGLNAQTTRGGHALPQNMTNEEAFDCGFLFKMMMIDGLAPNYEKIIVNNVCNDNHAGVFAYFLNQYVKGCAELKYKNVSITNHRTFLSHYIINDIGFIISHGKDDKTLKFGFKPQLDAKQIEKIDQYCKHNNLYNKTKRIIFKKGDSHQFLFDMAGSDDFDYYNYHAGSPSSQWVQNNFKKGRRGFVVENFKGLENSITPIFL